MKAEKLVVHWRGIGQETDFFHACMLSCLNRVQLFVTPWTVVHWAPLSMEFSRQEYLNGLP